MPEFIPRKKSFGMSLVEVLIAVFLLGAALLPIFDLIGKGAQITQTNENEVIAFNLAAELIDQISTIPYKYLPVIGGRSIKNEDNGSYLVETKGKTNVFNPTLLVLSPLPQSYERILTIEEFSSKPTCCLKKVIVKVLWGPAPQRVYLLTSLIEWRP